MRQHTITHTDDRGPYVNDRRHVWRLVALVARAQPPRFRERAHRRHASSDGQKRHRAAPAASARHKSRRLGALIDVRWGRGHLTGHRVRLRAAALAAAAASPASPNSTAAASAASAAASVASAASAGGESLRSARQLLGDAPQRWPRHRRGNCARRSALPIREHPRRARRWRPSLSRPAGHDTLGGGRDGHHRFWRQLCDRVRARGSGRDSGGLGGECTRAPPGVPTRRLWQRSDEPWRERSYGPSLCAALCCCAVACGRDATPGEPAEYGQERQRAAGWRRRCWLVRGASRGPSHHMRSVHAAASRQAAAAAAAALAAATAS